MKNLILMLPLMALASCADAQKVKEADVPAPAKEQFQKLYPGISAKWEKENGNYEAEFEVKEVETTVVFDTKGILLETEKEIALTELPQNTKDYLAKNKAGEKIKEAALIIDASGKKTYEAEVKGVDLLFDENGNFIKAEKD